jgi:hypothetical protein
VNQDPFADIRDKRMSELNPEQQERARELWLRTQIGPGDRYWYEQLQLLFRIIDRLRAPINMVLHCPKCGLQHIDEPDQVEACGANGSQGCSIKPCGPEGEDQCEFCGDAPPWTNPPHRSHLCHGCGHRWRPADVPTNGVAAVKTRGKQDSTAADAPPQPAK